MELPAEVQGILDDLTACRKRLADEVTPLANTSTQIGYQLSYLHGRLLDIDNLLSRLARQNVRLIQLAHRENAFTPVVRPREQYSKRLQKVLAERHRIVMSMRLDLESLYVFGNLAMDHWSNVLGYILEVPGAGSWKFPFSAFHDKTLSAQQGTKLYELVELHGPKIYWLFYNLRIYRNGFVEHLDRPLQRGASLPNYRLGFSLSVPTAAGIFTDEERDKLLEPLSPIVAPLKSRLGLHNWQVSPRGSLQTLFHNIDLVPEATDRELISSVWKKLGGETVTYLVLGRRFVDFMDCSIAAAVSATTSNDT